MFKLDERKTIMQDNARKTIMNEIEGSYVACFTIIHIHKIWWEDIAIFFANCFTHRYTPKKIEMESW